MKDFGFGITLTLVGMGTTLITIWLITVIIKLLDRLFPYDEKCETKK